MNSIFDVDYMIESIPKIIVFLPVTLGLTIVSVLIGAVIGLFTSLFRIYKVPVLRQLSAFYVSFIRGTPLLVQMYLVFYGLPKILYFIQTEYGWLENVNVNVIPAFYYALLSFSINLGAYLSETFRSAIESVDRGQFEAAHSIGMSQAQTMYKIILPQALLAALPNLGNILISTIKDTSLVFIIGIVDVMGQAKIIGARSLAFFEVYVAVSIIYYLVCLVLERILNKVEKRIKKYERSVVS